MKKSAGCDAASRVLITCRMTSSSRARSVAMTSPRVCSTWLLLLSVALSIASTMTSKLDDYSIAFMYESPVFLRHFVLLSVMSPGFDVRGKEALRGGNWGGNIALPSRLESVDSVRLCNICIW